AAQSAGHLEPVEGLQYLSRPVLPDRILGALLWRRTLFLQLLQVAGVTQQSIAAQQQADPGRVTFSAEAVLADVSVALIGKNLPGGSRIDPVDSARQVADTAVRTEAVRVAQHHGLLCQRMEPIIPRLQSAVDNAQTADLLQSAAGFLAVTTGVGVPAHITQRLARLHRG